ncbi:MAG: hypothetical protein OEN56_03745 [Gemmatimonadota bacterium]|nr:hypothetical protein [Gemmatimonadota bacterium]
MSDVASTVAVARAIKALGGAATLGDVIMATGLSLQDAESSVSTLMAEERVEVSVSESAVLVYRLDVRRRRIGHPERSESRRWRPARAWLRRGERPCPFDRKTLRLIRARGGVISIAELVEHTGLTVEGAEQEARRLALRYGGEAHDSLDGHVVWAFPVLVESAHGDFHVREPRPAWARARDPMDGHGLTRTWAAGVFGFSAAGLGALSWAFTFPPGVLGRIILLSVVAGASTATAFALTGGIVRRVARHPRLRLRHTATVRRYAFGYVVETALKGKGVVSLDRTVAHLRARAAGGGISRTVVERALRLLADEFDAPISEHGGDVFFGFRNVKRQFLASQISRAQLRLQRSAEGETVYDSGDSESVAGERELESFDRALLERASWSESRSTANTLPSTHVHPSRNFVGSDPRRSNDVV